jgi:membrane associated rhomboid family serine protease
VLLFVAKLALQTKGINLDDYLGLHHHLASNFKPYQFVTYIFMHGDFTHILFNMIGVYVFGQALEQLWGPKRYLIFYIVTGLGAAAAQYAINHFQIIDFLGKINELINSPDTSIDYRNELINYKYRKLNDSVIVGASGSLFGLLGAFGMLFPNTQLYLYFFIPVKAKWLVIGYGAFEIFSGIRNNPGDNVAHFAHIGGLLVGVILVLIWRKNRKQFY